MAHRAPSDGPEIYEQGEFVVIVTHPSALQAELSPAETAVVELVANGLSNVAVAHARGTSPRTVANQIASALAKLELPSRSALGAWWATRGKHGARA